MLQTYECNGATVLAYSEAHAWAQLDECPDTEDACPETQRTPFSPRECYPAPQGSR
jgi:hypothetical protein